jgi:vacuolar-type H+-ATPase subunit B/Vma2
MAPAPAGSTSANPPTAIARAKYEIPGHCSGSPESYLAERSGALSLTQRRLKSSRDTPMNPLPVDRALRSYSTLANRSQTKGSRERLSKHLMKKYNEGENDQHRLTVHGLSFLRDLDREIDSRN